MYFCIEIPIKFQLDYKSNLQGESINTTDIATIFNGAVAEQFTGQEILVSQAPYSEKNNIISIPFYGINAFYKSKLL